MGYTRDREETIAQLTREGWTLDAIRKLLRAAKKAQRAAVAECNGPPEHMRAGNSDCAAWVNELARYSTAAAAAVHRAVDGQPHLDCAIGGDPRGYVVKLRLKSGRSNHWGGETWGIPA